MEFKHNHSEGPWNFDGLDVLSKKNQTTIDGGYIMEDDDIPLIVQAPAMRDYLIKRAKWLWKELLFAESARNIEEDVETELVEVISILRSAGVDVIE